MRKFIALTNTVTGEEFLLRAKKITSVSSIGDKAQVHTKTDSIKVNQSYQQVKELLRRFYPEPIK